MTFGEYLTTKRKERGIPLRTLAKELNISPSFLCDLESGYRTVPSEERFKGLMGGIVAALSLNEEESATLRALADKSILSKGKVPLELVEYLQKVPSAQLALRKATENNTSGKAWDDFAESLGKEK